VSHYTPKKTVPQTLSDHQPKERECIACRKRFWSLGPGNRFCAPCKKKLADDRQGGREVRNTVGH
jgi:hypothetical protein